MQDGAYRPDIRNVRQCWKSFKLYVTTAGKLSAGMRTRN